MNMIDKFLLLPLDKGMINRCVDLFIIILNTNREFPSEKFYLKNGFKPLEETIILAK